MLNIYNSTYSMHHINKMKNKYHMSISIDAEKILDKIQHDFILKTLRIIGIEETFYNTTKAMYEKTSSI